MLAKKARFDKDKPFVNASTIRQTFLLTQNKHSCTSQWFGTFVAFGLEPFKVDGTTTYAQFNGSTTNYKTFLVLACPG
jgi:hypothetical protein